MNIFKPECVLNAFANSLAKQNTSLETLVSPFLDALDVIDELGLQNDHDHHIVEVSETVNTAICNLSSIMGDNKTVVKDGVVLRFTRGNYYFSVPAGYPDWAKAKCTGIIYNDSYGPWGPVIETWYDMGDDAYFAAIYETRTIGGEPVPLFPNDITFESLLDSVAEAISINNLSEEASRLVANGKNAVSEFYGMVASRLANGSANTVNVYNNIARALQTTSPVSALSTLMGSMYQGYATATPGSSDNIEFQHYDYTLDSSIVIAWDQFLSGLATIAGMIVSIFKPVVGLAVYAAGTVASYVMQLIQQNQGNVPVIAETYDNASLALPVLQITRSYQLPSPAAAAISDNGVLNFTSPLISGHVWSKPAALNADNGTLYYEAMPTVAVKSNSTISMDKLRALGRIQFSISRNSDTYNLSYTRMLDTHVSGMTSAYRYYSATLLGWDSAFAPSEVSLPVASESNNSMWNRWFTSIFFNALVACASKANYTNTYQGTSVGGRPINNYTADDLLVKSNAYDFLAWFVAETCSDTFTSTANLLNSYDGTIVWSWEVLMKAARALRTIYEYEDTTILTILDLGVTDELASTYPPIGDAVPSDSDSRLNYFIWSNEDAQTGNPALIPPQYRYSLLVRSAITLGIVVASVTIALVVKAKVKKAIQRRTTQKYAEVQQKLAQYSSSGSTEDWNAYWRSVKQYNRRARFLGLSTIGATDGWLQSGTSQNALVSAGMITKMASRSPSHDSSTWTLGDVHIAITGE